MRRIGSDYFGSALAYLVTAIAGSVAVAIVVMLTGGVYGVLGAVILAPLLLVLSIPGGLLSSAVAVRIPSGPRLSMAAAVISGLSIAATLATLVLLNPTPDSDSTGMGALLTAYGVMLGASYGWLCPRLRAGEKSALSQASQSVE